MLFSAEIDPLPSYLYPSSLYKETSSKQLKIEEEMYNIKTCVNLKVNKYWQKTQSGNSEQSINIKTPTDKRPGDWLCPKDGCFNVNFSWRESCNKCNTRNP